MIFPLTYPRHPGRFAAALFLSAAAVFGGYWLTLSFRRPVVPGPPEPGRGGLELVAVGAMTSPRAARTFSPKWKPELEPPEVDVPETPRISTGLLPAASELKSWGFFSRPWKIRTAPDVKIALGPVQTTQPEVKEWSLLPGGVKPPETRIPKPEVKQTRETAVIPPPPLDEHLGPRLLPEMLNRGEPVPPAHPAATGPPLRP